MGKRTSRVAIPKDVRGIPYATLAMWHLNDAMADHKHAERPPQHPLPDDVVRAGREARDERIIAEARAAMTRFADRRLARSSSGE